MQSVCRKEVTMKDINTGCKELSLDYCMMDQSRNKPCCIIKTQALLIYRCNSLQIKMPFYFLNNRLCCTTVKAFKEQYISGSYLALWLIRFPGQGLKERILQAVVSQGCKLCFPNSRGSSQAVNSLLCCPHAVIIAWALQRLKACPGKTAGLIR